MRVEAVRVVDAGDAALVELADVATPEQIEVVFTTRQDLTAYRARWGVPFIRAQIAACADGAAGTNSEVVVQDAGYLPDARRVRALGRIGGEAERYAYRAVFDNVLVGTGENHETKLTPASSVPGGLCFDLNGATLVRGSVRSATIPLRFPKR